MFTLYHIPKRKEWGCTKDLNARLKKLGYTIDDVFETLKVDDKNTASYLERELNIMYGYGWNSSQDYRRITQMGLKGSEKAAEVIRGSKFTEEHKNKLSKSLKGLKRTDLQKQKIKESHKGRVKITLLKNNVEFNFNSMTEASDYLGVSIQAVYNCYNNKSKTVQGYTIKK